MTERTRTLITYAICGFANFGSMGILIGGLSIMCPERRPDFLALAWKTLFRRHAGHNHGRSRRRVVAIFVICFRSE